MYGARRARRSRLVLANLFLDYGFDTGWPGSNPTIAFARYAVDGATKAAGGARVILNGNERQTIARHRADPGRPSSTSRPDCAGT